MKGTPAEEKHDHNGHQHPNQRPLPTWDIPGITMLIAITILKEKKNYSQFRAVSRTKGSHSRQREDYFQEQNSDECQSKKEVENDDSDGHVEAL